MSALDPTSAADRARALDIAQDALDGLPRGRTRVMLVHGRAGSGRTRLLDDIAELSAERQLTVARLSRSTPFSLFADDQLFPLHASRAPAVVLIDDLDGCDASLRLAFRVLPGRLDRAMLWAAATSPDDLEAFLPQPSRRAPGRPAPTAADVSIDLIRLSRSGDGPVAALAGRIAALDPGNLRVVAGAALLGDGFLPEDVAELLDLPLGAVIVATLAAIQQGLLRSDGDDLVFTHAVLRERALLAAEPDAELVARALRILIRRGRSPHRLARLTSAAHGLGRRFDDVLLAQVADAAARSDVAAAARVARLELGQRPADDPARDDAAARLVSYLGLSGRLDAAAGVIDDLGPRAGASSRFVYAELIASSHDREAEDVAREGLRRDDLRSSERARLEAVASVAAMIGGRMDPLGFEAVAARAISSGDHRAAGIARIGRAMIAHARGRWSEALEQAAAASDRVGDDPTDPTFWHAGLLRATLLKDVGRTGEAVELLRSIARELEVSGRVLALPNILTVLAACRMADLDLVAAEHAARKALVLSLALGMPGAVWFSIAGILMRVHWYRGDAGAARHLRHEIADAAPGEQFAAILEADSLLWDAGDAESDDVAGAFRRWIEHPQHAVSLSGLSGDITDDVSLLRALVRNRDAEGIERVRARLQQTISAGGFPLGAAALSHAEGLLDGDPLRIGDAIATYTRTGRRALLAWAHEDLAGILSESDTAAAIEELGRARGIWVEAGAEREAARTEHRLRDLGARPAVVRSGESLGLGLSAAEERVVRELLHGGTNVDIGRALYLSPHTVAVHLRKVYAKLQVGSRGELIEFVRTRIEPGSSHGED